MTDVVNHPSHYTDHPSGVECITVTEHMGFCVGNAIKYLWRAGRKGCEIEDLQKAKWYIEREIARLSPDARRPTAGFGPDAPPLPAAGFGSEGCCKFALVPDDTWLRGRTPDRIVVDFMFNTSDDAVEDPWVGRDGKREPGVTRWWHLDDPDAPPVTE